MGISAGFIAPSGRGLMHVEGGRWWHFEVDAVDTVPFADVLARFRAAHPDYAVAVRSDTVFVSHIDLEDPSIFQPVLVNFSAAELFPTVAFRRAIRLIDRTIPDYGYVVVGAGRRPPGRPPTVSLETGETTIRGVFDAIACAVPGTVWELTKQEHPTRGDFFTLIVWQPPGN